MIAVCDAEFIIFSLRISIFEKFVSNYDKIYITNIVRNEILEDFEKIKDKVIVIEVPKDKYFHYMILNRIDEGEASSIVLAKELGAIFLTDDKRARKAAKKEGIEVKGILGVIIDLVENGKINEKKASKYIQRLLDEGFWIEERLLKEVESKIGKIPEEDPEPEDIKALKIAMEQYKEGEYVTWEELEKELKRRIYKKA